MKTIGFIMFISGIQSKIKNILFCVTLNNNIQHPPLFKWICLYPAFTIKLLPEAQ